MKLSEFAQHERILLRRIIRANGTIRMSKPDIEDDNGKMAAYIWRMLVWCMSIKPSHQCTPILCFWELPAKDLVERLALAKALDQTVYRVLCQVPYHRRYPGIHTWI